MHIIARFPAFVLYRQRHAGFLEEVPIVVGPEAGPDTRLSGMKPILRPEGGDLTQSEAEWLSDSVISMLSLHSHRRELSIHGLHYDHLEIARRLYGLVLFRFPKL